MKEYVEKAVAIERARNELDLINKSHWSADEIVDFLKRLHAVDVVEVVRCTECKHRPTKPEKYIYGIDLEFPDEACPCYHADEPFSSWYPSDDWFCPRGERKGGAEDAADN